MVTEFMLSVGLHNTFASAEFFGKAFINREGHRASINREGHRAFNTNKHQILFWNVL